MGVSYNKLLKKLVDLKISPAQFAKEIEVSANIATHLKKDEYVSMQTVEKICRYLKCGVDEVLDFVDDETKDK